jgi:hypothetical protein
MIGPNCSAKIRSRGSLEITDRDYSPVQVGHTVRDVLAKHELMPALRDFDGAKLPRPILYA